MVLGDGFTSGGGILSSELIDDAQENAQILKEQGVEVFALAVGDEKNTLLLKEFVSNSSYYIEVSIFFSLWTLLMVSRYENYHFDLGSGLLPKIYAFKFK